MKKGIIVTLSSMAGAVVGAIAIEKLQSKVIEQKNDKVNKFKSYYNMLNQWLILKQDGKTLVNYFTDNNYKTIAIYGMGEMGERLYEELKDSSVEVKYAIDKNTTSMYSRLEVYDPDDTLEKVDAVIVSAVFAFDEIEENLSGKFDCPIISLEDVIYES